MLMVDGMENYLKLIGLKCIDFQFGLKELKKEMEKSKDLIPKITGVYTKDKMTANQISAEVKSYFD